MATDLDADDIIVAANGNVWVGPVGTAAPTDLVTALNAAFIDCGYINEDGVTFTPTWSSNPIMAWQSFRPLRRVVTERAEEVSFSLMQWKKSNIPLAFGGGTVTTAAAVHTFTPPVPGDRDERAMIVEWQDGTKDYRLVIPKGEVTDGGEANLTRSEAALLPITFTINADEGADGFYVLSNDPAWA